MMLLNISKACLLSPAFISSVHLTRGMNWFIYVTPLPKQHMLQMSLCVECGRCGFYHGAVLYLRGCLSALQSAEVYLIKLCVRKYSQCMDRQAAMAGGNAEKQRPRRRSWRKSAPCVSRRLLCCLCLRGEEKDPLQEQEEKINGGPQHPHLDQLGSVEREAIQIRVEDLGIVNAGFSLLEEEPVTSRNSVARSASSVSGCPRTLEKKQLKPLSSLPIESQAITSTSEEDNEEEEEDLLLCDSSTASFLTPPVINLIPPSPSDVVDDDQFFDINSEESVVNTSCSDGSLAAGEPESYEEKMESVETEEDITLAENKIFADKTHESKESPGDESGKEREYVTTKEMDKEKAKSKFLHSAYQVAPLPEYPQKSECKSDNPSGLLYY